MIQMIDALEAMDESARWNARDVSYWSGRWDQVSTMIPTFELGDFRASSDTPPNPHMRAVIRKPLTAAEQPVPVGVVSKTYSLAQHTDVADKCFEGITSSGIDPRPLRCEIGLTQLGEWMNLRVYFPEKFTYEDELREVTNLRMECFNSVEGSSRLIVLLGWQRFVCSNGMVIGETKVELRDLHNRSLDLDRIPKIIQDGLNYVGGDMQRFEDWAHSKIELSWLTPWADQHVAALWGKKAACRVFHICTRGVDVDFADPFSSGKPTEKSVTDVENVPGSVVPTSNLYHVSQALSWVASRRSNPEVRVDWQGQIPDLLDALTN